jgi:ABC-type branched-subunit amino acid transport system substrate-binding protein
MINDQGGVNGRKITLLSLDDGYSPPKTVEQTRRLVEDEQVLAIVGSLGTAPNSAVRKYLNGKKVPQLFLASGASKWADPEHFPWSMPWAPSFHVEGKIYARYILRTIAAPKIAVLYQNDDFGKDNLQGLKNALGEAAGRIVATASYEATDPTVDSQIVALRASGADVLVDFTTPKFTAQAIRKVHDIGWRPLQFVSSVGSSTGAAIRPAGFERAQGIISAHFQKDATDQRWRDDDGMRGYLAFMRSYAPELDTADQGTYYGYNVAATFVQVLRQCGDEITRENLMRQAASLKGFAPPMLLPGITLNTGPGDFHPIKRMQLVRFEGEGWSLFGDVEDGQ